MKDPSKLFFNIYSVYYFLNFFKEGLHFYVEYIL